MRTQTRLPLPARIDAPEARGIFLGQAQGGGTPPHGTPSPVSRVYLESLWKDVLNLLLEHSMDALVAACRVLARFLFFWSLWPRNLAIYRRFLCTVSFLTGHLTTASLARCSLGSSQEVLCSIYCSATTGAPRDGQGRLLTPPYRPLYAPNPRGGADRSGPSHSLPSGVWGSLLHMYFLFFTGSLLPVP